MTKIFCINCGEPCSAIPETYNYGDITSTTGNYVMDKRVSYE